MRTLMLLMRATLVLFALAIVPTAALTKEEERRSSRAPWCYSPVNTNDVKAKYFGDLRYGKNSPYVDKRSILEIAQDSQSKTEAEERNQQTQKRIAEIIEKQKKKDLEDDALNEELGIVSATAVERRDKAKPIDKLFAPAKQNFFPKMMSDRTRNWYSNELESMGEAPMQKLSDPTMHFDFRFLWLRSFHHPILVRITKFADGKVLLASKELSSNGDDQRAHLLKNNELVWTQKEFEQFQRKLAKTKFFHQSSEIDSRGQNDGAQWIFEINDRGRYHFIDRWSASGADRDLGIFLLKAAGLLPNKEDIY